ncbi:MAG: LysR family transcriptional regulator [Steroidobacteraceae bacterium]
MQLVKQADTPRPTSCPIRPLELRQYRYFVILAEELHFARAAERLNIGQSNLSREIRFLEHQNGLRLLYRNSRRTELSVAGEGLLDQARRVLAAEEHARLAIGEFKRSAKDRLGIGICERVACSRIAGALVDWRRTNPDVGLQIVSRSGRALLDEIEAGLLHAGITAMRVNESGIVGDQLWTDAWVAAVPKNHLLASSRAIEPAQLARERLALLAPDPICTLEQQIIERMPTDSPLFIAERPSTASALMTWVEAGCGIGLLTASQGEGVAHPNVILRPFRHGLPPAEVHLLRSDGPMSPLLSGLIECLRATRP